MKDYLTIERYLWGTIPTKDDENLKYDREDRFKEIIRVEYQTYEEQFTLALRKHLVFEQEKYWIF